jgi:DnaT-like ssDNA binding protein
MMAVIELTVTDYLGFYGTVEVISEIFLPIYGNLTEGNNYFSRRLRSKDWKEATDDEKIAALTEATRLIDRLNFSGSKYDATQFLQFPRGTDTTVPYDIKFACYELALALLSGKDPDTEIENLGSTSQGFGGLRDTYDRSFVLDHIRAGIPSPSAWAYLKPYLIDPETIRISRVD